jgi:hypothetical protein
VSWRNISVDPEVIGDGAGVLRELVANDSVVGDIGVESSYVRI